MNPSLYIGAISKSLYTQEFQRPMAIRFIMPIFLMIVNMIKYFVKHVLDAIYLKWILTMPQQFWFIGITVRVNINQLSIFTVFKYWQMRRKNKSWGFGQLLVMEKGKYHVGGVAKISIKRGISNDYLLL